MLPAVAPVVNVLPVHESSSRSTRSTISSAEASTAVATLCCGRWTWTFWSVRETTLSAHSEMGRTPPVTKP